MLAVVMWFGRFGVIVPVLAIAGSLAAKEAYYSDSGNHAYSRVAVYHLVNWHGVAGRPAQLCSRSRLRADGQGISCYGSAAKGKEKIMSRKMLTLFDPTLTRSAIVDAFKKLDPRVQWRISVNVRSLCGQHSEHTTMLWVQALGGQGEASVGFILAIALWLWFTVLFANFAEALAEGRSKAQAASLRGVKKTVSAKKLREPRYGGTVELIPGAALRRGDVVLIEAGDMIPADGEVIEGVASVNSAITGESAQ